MCSFERKKTKPLPNLPEMFTNKTLSSVQLFTFFFIPGVRRETIYPISQIFIMCISLYSVAVLVNYVNQQQATEEPTTSVLLVRTA